MSSSAPGVSASSATIVVSVAWAVTTTSPTSFCTERSTPPVVSNVLSMTAAPFRSCRSRADGSATATPAPVGPRAALECAQNERVHRHAVSGSTLLEAGLEAVAQAQGDAGRQVVALPHRVGLILDIGQLDVVACHADVDVPVRQCRGQLGGGLRQEVQHAPGYRAPEDIGDPLGHQGHRVVAEFADGDHVRAQPVDHE